MVGVIAKFIAVCLVFSCVGCGTMKNKSLYIPDKFSFQVNTDPNKNEEEFVDQVRFGLVWDLDEE